MCLCNDSDCMVWMRIRSMCNHKLSIQLPCQVMYILVRVGGRTDDVYVHYSVYTLPWRLFIIPTIPGAVVQHKSTSDY